MLLNGGFSPLTGFMNKADYESVCSNMKLASGVLWPMPITLDVTEAFAKTLKSGSSKIALRDAEGVMIAILHVEDVWQPDRQAEGKAVFNSTSNAHPGVAYLMNRSNPWYVGGRLEGLQLPSHYDFKTLRQTPAELRAEFASAGWRRIVAFQTRNPMHRAHVELTFRAAKQVEASLLIHPVVGMTKPGDVDYFTRVRCYQLLVGKYPAGTGKLALVPFAMRMGGPREAIWHALIRKNYGCTHLIVGRDHAGPGKDTDGKPFYGPYEAQELFAKHEEEIGVKQVPFQMMVYLEDKDKYFPANEVPKDARVLDLSGTELRNRLNEGRDIPSWFTYPEVATELRRSFPPRHKQGVTIFFSGLSGSGKSTIANVLMTKFLEVGGRPVTMLDGDLVRKHLSSELGFSKEHRDINIRRIGYVASEITKNGGIAICAPIAPYDRHPQRRARPHRAGRRFHPRPSLHLGGCVRRPRSQRPLRQGPRRHPERIHRHLGSLRGTDRRRAADQHRRAQAGRSRPRNHPAPRARRLHRDESQLGLTTQLNPDATAAGKLILPAAFCLGGRARALVS